MLPALLALAPTAFQIAEGLIQNDKADKLKPSNYVPPSVDSALNMAKANANKTVAPGYGRQLQVLRTGDANSFDRARKVAGDASQLQQQVGNIDARDKEVGKDLTTQNQQFQFNSRQDLMKWLGMRGEYEKSSNDAFNATKSALRGAATQNFFNAATGAAGVGINMLGNPASSIIGKTGTALTNAISGYKGKMSPDELMYLKNMGFNVNNGSLDFGNNTTSTSFNQLFTPGVMQTPSDMLRLLNEPK